MAVAYPTDILPLPVRDGFDETIQNPFTRFKRDDGKSIVIRKYTSQPNEVSLTWKLTWEQLKFFEGFIEYDLLGGTEWFDIQFGPTQPIRTVKFVGQPPGASFDEKTGTWRLTSKVEYMRVAPTRQALSYYPDFPASLPWPEKEGYLYDVPDALLVDKKETGYGKPESRRRFTNKATLYSLKWLFDNEQMAEFERFLRVDIADGLAYFRAPFANGMGEAQVRARFTAPPVKTPLGALAWSVSAQLETSEAPLVSEFNYRIRNGEYEATDAFVLSELVQFNFGQNLADAFAFAEAVTFSHGQFYNDAIVFAEEFSFSGNYNIMPADAISFAESGYLTTQDYIADDYFAESYVGYTVSF